MTTDKETIANIRLALTAEFRAWFDLYGRPVASLSHDELIDEDAEEILAAAVVTYRLFQKHERDRSIGVHTLVRNAKRDGHEQILGNDPRLAEFWQDAAKLADVLGYCDQFEMMSKMLGGPNLQRKL